MSDHGIPNSASNRTFQVLNIDFRHKDQSLLSYDNTAFNKAPELHGIDNTKKSTTLQASFTLFCSFVGVSCLSMPYSFHLVGLGLAVIFMLIIGYITYYSLSLILEVADALPGHEKLTLEILTYKILGSWTLFTVELAVTFLQLGVCTVALMFSSNFLDYVVCNFGIEQLCSNIPFRAITILIIIVPLTLINNMHWFYITSLFSTACIFIGLMTQIVFDFNQLEQSPEVAISMMKRISDIKYYNLPLFFGVATYAFEGIGTLFSVRASMQTPADLSSILRYQMILIVCLFIFFPAICYVTFGDLVPEIVIFTFPIDKFYLIVQFLLVGSALCGYALQLFPTLKILENSNIIRSNIFDERGNTKNPWLRYGLRLMIMLVMLCLVFSGLTINLWIGFVGACTSTFLGFVLPVLIYEKQFKGRMNLRTRIMNKVAFFAGVIMGLTGIVQTFGMIIGVFKHE